MFFLHLLNNSTEEKGTVCIHQIWPCVTTESIVKDTVMSGHMERDVMRCLMTLHLCRKYRMFFWRTEWCWETHTGGFSNSLCWTVKPGSRQYFFDCPPMSMPVMWVCVSGRVCVHVVCVLVIICMGQLSVQGLNKPTPLFPVWGTLRVFIKIIVTSGNVLVLILNTVLCFHNYTMSCKKIRLVLVVVVK